jgi:MtrB/PioB family decaheme-associated outer membrane protein
MTATARFLLFAVIVSSTAGAAAQTPATPQSSSPSKTDVAPVATAENEGGEVDLGARINSTPAMGRFFRYDDLRSGPVLDRLRYNHTDRAWRFSANVFDPGYRDQRYFAAFERHGQLRASFDYDQIPLWYGDVERTPFREASPGVFRLNDTLQAAVQNGAPISVYTSELQGLDVRSRRDTGTGRFTYSATRNLDLSFVMSTTRRTGSQPWGATFGLSNTTVLPVPLQRRNNDVTAAAEWSTARGMARIAWDGSWFSNDLTALTWDNPLRFTDTTAANAFVTGLGAAEGRMSLWPDSTAQTVSGTGSIALPHRSRLVAYASIGAWLQNDQLIPFTTNTAIAPIAMPRQTAEAKALVTSMNYRYSTRPTTNTWFTASYRLYDWDNQSTPFPLVNIVRVDQTLAPSPIPQTEPYGTKRQFIDVDGSYTGFRRVALRAGYGAERDRLTYRYLETSVDHQARGSLDITGLSWGSLRLQYDRSIRIGSGLDEQVLDDISEQQSLRQFDVANRTRDRLSAIVQYLPTASFGVSATANAGRERRPESSFGLHDNDLKGVTLGLDYTPGAFATAGIEYSFENYRTVQRSRQASPPPDPTFFDPRRDWTTNMNENVHSWSATLEFPRLAPKASARLSFDDVHDAARYVYELAPNSTLAPVVQLPSVRNHFDVVSADVRYELSNKVGVAIGYRLEHFDSNDFALTPGIMDTPLIPTFINLQYQWRPYTVNTGDLRLIYRF